MGPAPNSRIDHTTRKEDFTQNLIHESQTSITICYAFKMLLFLQITISFNRGLKEKNEKQKKYLNRKKREKVEEE